MNRENKLLDAFQAAYDSRNLGVTVDDIRPVGLKVVLDIADERRQFASLGDGKPAGFPTMSATELFENGEAIPPEAG